MSENHDLPSGWCQVKLADAFEIRLGKMLSKASKTGKNSKPYLANRNVQWDRVNLNDLEVMDFSDAEQEKFQLRRGDLLVCEGGEVGRTAMWHGEKNDCYYQKAIHRLRPTSGQVIPGYMLRFMRFAATNGWFTEFTSQSSIAHLTREKLASLPINAPTVPEQRKIASILATLDGLIERTEALIEKYRRVKQGMMADLLSRGVDAYGKLRPSQQQAPHLYKQSELGWVPKEWEVSTLGSACSLLRDGTHLPPQRVDSGPRLLSVQNMIGGKFRLTTADTRVPWDFYNRMHTAWQPKVGDVLLAIVGATLGKVCRVPEGFPTFTLQRSVAIFRGLVGVLRTEFLYYYMLADSFQTAIWNRANQTAQPGVYLAELSRISVPLPPHAEQMHLCKVMQDMDRLIDWESTKKDKLFSIKSGLMQDLLTGKVRVKVDEAEEVLANA